MNETFAEGMSDCERETVNKTSQCANTRRGQGVNRLTTVSWELMGDNAVEAGE